MQRRQFLSAAMAAPALASLAHGQSRFRAELGINIYSVRSMASKDLPGTLKLLKELGFRMVEAGDLYGRSAKEFQVLLKSNGLRATAFGASYKALDTQIETVAADAKTIGAKYVVCSTIPHSAKHLTASDVTSAAQKLNAWGKVLTKHGLKLCYHTHGTEFDPSPDGTQFDSLLKQTDPKHVNYEMDIFWIVYGLQDPVDFLKRYPNRFPLMHVKDMRHGMVLNQTPAQVAEDDSVPLGTGVVKIPPALEAGQKYGVKHFYLEEEAVDALPQIKQSLKFIEGLR